jgi:hypothetical protein
LDLLFDLLPVSLLRQASGSSMRIAPRLSCVESPQTGRSAPAGAFGFGRGVIRPAPVAVWYGLGSRTQIDAVYRTRRHTQFATRAFRFDDGMHLLGGTNDRVHRACLDAQGTANASTFVDYCGAACVVPAKRRIERFEVNAQQHGKPTNCMVAAWRTLIDVGVSLRHCPSIGAAIRVSALGALRLRKPGINRIDIDRARHRRMVVFYLGLSATGRVHRPDGYYFTLMPG